MFEFVDIYLLKTNIDDSAKLEGTARIYEMDLLLACYKRQKISNSCIN